MKVRASHALTFGFKGVRFTALILGWAVLLTGSVMAGEDLRDLDLSHWANPVLARFQAQGYLNLSETRPFHRDRVAGAVSRMLAKFRAGNLNLSRADLYNLKRLCQEFLPDTVFEFRRLVKTDILKLQEGKAFLRGDFAPSGIADFAKGAKPAYSGHYALDLWGSTGKSFVFDEQFTVLEQREVVRDMKVVEEIRAWHGGEFLTDWSYFRFRAPWFTATVGRSQNWWGPGQFGTLLLSDNAPTFDALDLAVSYRRLAFNSFAGILSTEDHRYISGHRLTLATPGRVDLGLSEVVVYQGPNILPSYLNPLVPFYAVHWNARPNDNILWLMDAAWRPGWGLKGYGEFLIDDFIYEPARTPAPNRLGFLGGLDWVNPFRLSDTDLKLEYAGNEKWVYTNRTHDNRYVGNDTSKVLGHWIGTDADVIDAALEHRFHPRLNLGLGFEQQRHGEGQVGISWESNPSDTHTRFLSGIVEREDFARVYCDWQPVFWATLTSEAKFGKDRNLGHVPGQDQNIRAGTFSLKLDF